MSKATHDTAVIEFPGARAHNAAYDDVDFGGPSGPGGGGGMLEARVARLEVDVEYIKRDVAEIKTSLGKVVSDVGDIKVSLAEVKARQEAFSTQEQLQRVKTDLEKQMHGQTRWLIAAVFAIVAGVAAVERFLPTPISESVQPHVQVSGEAMVKEPAPEVKGK